MTGLAEVKYGEFAEPIAVDGEN
jgi:hypothetical protein